MAKERAADRWMQLVVRRALTSIGSQRAQHSRGVREQLEHFEKTIPAWKQSPFWRALLVYLNDNRKVLGAIAQLRRYLNRSPTDARAWTALLSLKLESLRVRRLDGLDGLTEDQRRQVGDALAADAARLRPIAGRAEELRLLAAIHGLRGELDVGLGFIARALALESTRSRCLETQAQLLFLAGKPADAASALSKAIGSRGHGSESTDIDEAALEAYEKAGDDEGAQPAAMSPRITRALILCIDLSIGRRLLEALLRPC